MHVQSLKLFNLNLAEHEIVLLKVFKPPQSRLLSALLSGLNM